MSPALDFTAETGFGEGCAAEGRIGFVGADIRVEPRSGIKVEFTVDPPSSWQKQTYGEYTSTSQSHVDRQRRKLLLGGGSPGQHVYDEYYAKNAWNYAQVSYCTERWHWEGSYDKGHGVSVSVIDEWKCKGCLSGPSECVEGGKLIVPSDTTAGCKDLSYCDQTQAYVVWNKYDNTIVCSFRGTTTTVEAWMQNIKFDTTAFDAMPGSCDG